MKLSTRITSILFLLVICSCGRSSFEEAKITKAPSNENELGFIIYNLNENDLENLYQAYPSQLKYRLISHSVLAYEVTGLTKEEITAISPQAQIEQNKFITNHDIGKKTFFNKTNTKESYLKIFNQSSQSNPCKLNDQMPVPNFSPVKMSGAEYNSDFYVGDKIKVFHNNDNPEGEVFWRIISPSGSNVKSDLITNTLYPEFDLDMPGVYLVLLIYKKADECNFKEDILPVSFNEDYKTVETEYDKLSHDYLSKQDFIQIPESHASDLDFTDQVKAKIKVAIIDTGVNYNHPALKNKIWTNKKEIPGNGLDDDMNGYVDDFLGYDFMNYDPYPMDDNGHGSHVAGLVAGDFMGVADSLGLNNSIEIMSLKALHSVGGGDLGSYLAALDYAIQNEADIINLSMGAANMSPLEKQMISKAMQKGVLLVAAAGNGDGEGVGQNNDELPIYPASFTHPNLISVAAVNDSVTGDLTTYSNYGKKSVDLAAVGGHANMFKNSPLLSAYLRNPKGQLLSGSIGTSMAAPLVSGAAALALSLNPDLRPSDLVSLIKSTGDKKDSLIDKVQSSAVLNTAKLLNEVQNQKNLGPLVGYSRTSK